MKTFAIAAAVVVLSCALASTVFVDRLPSVVGSATGETIGRDLISVAGRRFFNQSFIPDRLVSVGAYRPIGLQAIGFSVRIDGGREAGGLYFVFRGDIDSSYVVTVRGTTLRGRPLVAVRGDSTPFAGRQQNLLKSAADLGDKQVWFGSAPGAAAPDAGTSRILFDATHTYIYQAMDRPTEDGTVYQVSFMGRVVSGTPAVTVFVNRGGGYDGASQTMALTPAWRRYSFFHHGRWAGRSSLQMGFQRLSDTVFDIRDLRITQAPSARDLVRPWSDSPRLPAGVLPNPATEAPDGQRAFILRGTDSIGVLVYGLADFSYQLDRICVDSIENDDEAAERTAACTPVTK